MGPIVSGSELRAIIHGFYPRAYTPAIDRRYILPSEDFARRQLVGMTIKDYGFKPEVFDCDDFCMVFLGRVRERQFREKWAHPAAIGVALGNLKDGQNHATNVAVTDMETVVWLDSLGHDMTDFKPRLIWI